MEDKTFKLPLQFGEEIALPDGRFVSTAIIEKDNQDFWAIYRVRKSEMKKAGIFIFKENEQWVCKRYRNDNQKIEESMAISSEIKIKAPKGLDYYPYQKAGIEYISKKPSALIADEMGLGKTIQAIGLMNSVELPTVLVVVPASVKINWGIECNTWLVKNRDIKTIENGKDEFPVNPDIVIINYDLLKKFKDEILTRTWSYVIFDECHYLKNPKTARSKVALKIKADRKVALTGTPIPNKPIELQPVAGYLSPNVFGNFFSYAYNSVAHIKLTLVVRLFGILMVQLILMNYKKDLDQP